MAKFFVATPGIRRCWRRSRAKRRITQDIVLVPVRRQHVAWQTLRFGGFAKHRDPVSPVCRGGRRARRPPVICGQDGRRHLHSRGQVVAWFESMKASEWSATNRYGRAAGRRRTAEAGRGCAERSPPERPTRGFVLWMSGSARLLPSLGGPRTFVPEAVRSLRGSMPRLARRPARPPGGADPAGKPAAGPGLVGAPQEVSRRQGRPSRGSTRGRSPDPSMNGERAASGFWRWKIFPRRCG